MMEVKIIVKKALSKFAPILPYIPGWDKLVINNCQIKKNKTNLLGKVVNFLFSKEYYTRPPALRSYIQSKLMGGVSGSDWANFYYESTTSIEERGKIGNLEYHQAYPEIKTIKELITTDPKSFCVIQLGASSGREISYFAKTFPEADFIYTDIYESVTSYASTKLSLPNLDYVTCPAESLPPLAEISKKQRIVIFSSASSQYVYPEHLDSLFRLLSKIKNKTIDFILTEPGNNLLINPATFKGSIPRSNFSYTHNYQFYAEKNNFKTTQWDLIKPFEPQKDFYPNHQGTVNLFGWFTYSG